MAANLTTPTPAAAPVSHVPGASQRDHGHEYPTTPVAPEFALVYEPGRWMVLAGRVVPDLIEQPLEAGSNGLSQSAPGKWRFAAWKSKLEEQNRTLIPWELGPDGSYCVGYDTRHPQTGQISRSYMSAFCTVYPGDSKVHANTEAYAAWLQSLIDNGHLPRPQQYLIREMLADRQQRIVALQRELDLKPTTARGVRVEVMRAEIAALEALIEAQPKAKPAKAKPSTPDEG